MAGDGYRVGVLGATGAVGSTILEVLAERGFPTSEVVPLASERSAGKAIECGEEELEVRPLSEETIQGLDIVLSSAGGKVSAEWAPKLVEAGAVVVDNTSYWRMHEDVPLVVAGVNPEAAESHKGIVANPNCTTMVAMMALAPIHRAAGLERIVVSSYQAVSGTGQKAIEELRHQSKLVLEGEERPPASVYPHRIAFNVLPQVEVFADGDDYTTEERKVMAETRKILGLGEEVGISATCARVPVFTGHSESVNVADPRGPLARGLPRRCWRARPACSSSTTRRRAVTRWPRGRRPRRGAGRPHPPRPRPRALPQPLGRRRQPAQGRRHQRRPGGRAAGRARPARLTHRSGLVQRKPSKRAKSVSPEHTSPPCSIASVARCASLVRLPAVPTGSSSSRRTVACRAVGWTMVVTGRVEPAIDELEGPGEREGVPNALGLVEIRTKPSRASHAKPTSSVPESACSSHDRAAV